MALHSSAHLCNISNEVTIAIGHHEYRDDGYENDFYLIDCCYVMDMLWEVWRGGRLRGGA